MAVHDSNKIKNAPNFQRKLVNSAWFWWLMCNFAHGELLSLYYGIGKYVSDNLLKGGDRYPKVIAIEGWIEKYSRIVVAIGLLFRFILK